MSIEQIQKRKKFNLLIFLFKTTIEKKEKKLFVLPIIIFISFSQKILNKNLINKSFKKI
jgi:hypothetical protein